MIEAKNREVKISWPLYLALLDQTVLAIQAETKALRQFNRELELELLMDKYLKAVNAGLGEISSGLVILVICSAEGHQQFVSLN